MFDNFTKLGYNSCMNSFTQILRQHNLKVTPQRLAIVEVIHNYGHINIDKLYEEIKIKFETISLATIYKNISAMTKNTILYEVKLPNEKSVYETVKDNHSHFLCKKCAEVTDIDINMEKNIKSITQKYDFSIEQTDLVLSGICDKCKDK